MKVREEKIKTKIEELFYKLINIKFEKEEMKKMKPIKKKKWYDRLIKQTMAREKKPKIIRDKLKDKIIRDIWTLFETDETEEKKDESQ